MYMYMIVHVCCITFGNHRLGLLLGLPPQSNKCVIRNVVSMVFGMKHLRKFKKERLSKIQGTEWTLPPLSAIPLKEEGLQLPKDRQDTVCRAPTHIWPAFPEQTNVAPLHFKRHNRLSPSQTPLAQTVT